MLQTSSWLTEVVKVGEVLPLGSVGGAISPLTGVASGKVVPPGSDTLGVMRPTVPVPPMTAVAPFSQTACSVLPVLGPSASTVP